MDMDRLDLPNKIARNVVFGGRHLRVAEQHQHLRVDIASGFRNGAFDEEITPAHLHHGKLATVQARQLFLRDVNAANLVGVRKMTRNVGALHIEHFAVEEVREFLSALALLACALLGFALRAIALCALGTVADCVGFREIDFRALAFWRRGFVRGRRSLRRRGIPARLGFQCAGKTAFQQLVAQGLRHDDRLLIQ